MWQYQVEYRLMVGGYSASLSLPCPSSALDSVCFCTKSSARLIWGLGWGGYPDLLGTRRGLGGALTHGFQVPGRTSAREFSRCRLGKCSRAGCLHPLEDWARNQAGPCLATPGCSFQPQAPSQADPGGKNITRADVLPFYTEHNESFQDDLFS